MKQGGTSKKRQIFLILGTIIPLLLLWWLASLRSWLPRKLPVEGTFYAVAASPTSSLLACSSNGGWIHIWDAQKRKRLWEKLESGRIERIVFSPNGQQMAGLVSGAEPHLMVWDAATGRPLRRLPARTKIEPRNAKLGFTQDGRILRFQTGEDTLDRFEVATGRQLPALDLSVSHLLAQQPNNPLLRSLRTPLGKGIVRKLWISEFAPGAMLVVVQVIPMGTTLSEKHWLGRDETWVCDETGRLRFPLPKTQGHFGRFSRDGHWLALYAARYGSKIPGTIPDGLQIWDVRKQSLVNTIPYQSLDVTISRDGKRLFVVHSVSNAERVTIYDVKTGREVRHLEAPATKGSNSPLFALSHDETAFALTEKDRDGATITLWRLK